MSDSWPAPEVPCRPATEEEAPRGAKAILKVAAEHDWKMTRCTYAVGTLPVQGMQWEIGPVVPSLVCGWEKDDLRIVASWVDGSFSFAYVNSKSRKDTTSVNSSELRAVLKGELK